MLCWQWSNLWQTRQSARNFPRVLGQSSALRCALNYYCRSQIELNVVFCHVWGIPNRNYLLLLPKRTMCICCGAAWEDFLLTFSGTCGRPLSASMCTTTFSIRLFCRKLAHNCGSVRQTHSVRPDEGIWNRKSSSEQRFKWCKRT